MPGALPDGEPVPGDGALPESVRAGLGRRPFGIYVHVPFCTTRCGYCDFNTYTAAELGARPVSPGALPISSGAAAVSSGAAAVSSGAAAVSSRAPGASPGAPAGRPVSL